MSYQEVEVAEVKGLNDVKVFQLCECDAVAAYSLEEAREWYKNLTGLEDDELYKLSEVSEVSLDMKVRKGEEVEGMITVGQIIQDYWNGEPFIAVTNLY
ncbi:hypothetical protein BEH_07900 [Priestia filamentosa]|uniref:Uncharacterized protein n=1 Tax=Priestia filamentosa TaxID=1402861 RepID=A0A0H4KIA9_9BACI|nr:hypothetical protein [Priestia filamentosa]AKO92029.1 hypothetical protein BEH_07900 [Priestia filamentosa]